MAAYNIYEAKTQLSALLEKALDGEDVVIARAGKPIARVIPLQPKSDSGEQEVSYRKAGGYEGQFDDLLDELDKPWPEEIQIAFGMID